MPGLADFSCLEALVIETEKVDNCGTSKHPSIEIRGGLVGCWQKAHTHQRDHVARSSC